MIRFQSMMYAIDYVGCYRTVTSLLPLTPTPPPPTPPPTLPIPSTADAGAGPTAVSVSAPNTDDIICLSPSGIISGTANGLCLLCNDDGKY